MGLRDSKIPYRALSRLQIALLPSQKEILEYLLTAPPIKEDLALVYFSTIRKNADRLYTVAMRMSQVAATAMECIEPGSSDQPKEEMIGVPEVPKELSEHLQEKKADEPSGGETEKAG